MKVFFPTYGGGHVKAILPIVKDMMQKQYSPIILALTTSCLELSNEEVTYSNVSSFFDLYSDVERGAISFFSEKYRQSSVIEGLSLEEINNYIGMNIFDLSLKSELFDIDSEYKKFGRKIFLPLDFAERVLDFLKPDAVFVTCGQRMERAMAMVASQKGIPVFRLIDLLGENVDIDYQATVFVINQIAKQNIMSKNKHIKDVVVTGNPNFVNSFVNEAGFKFDNSDKKPVVSVFSQPGIKKLEEVIQSIFNLSLSYSTILFVLKPHPSEDVRGYRKFNSRNFKVVESVDANFVIEKSDFIATFFSSVGFQAINQNKPLVVLNFHNEKYPLDYCRHVGVPSIRSVEEFERYLNSSINNENYHSTYYANYGCFQQPANSVEKIIESMEDSLLYDYSGSSDL